MLDKLKGSAIAGGVAGVTGVVGDVAYSYIIFKQSKAEYPDTKLEIPWKKVLLFQGAVPCLTAAVAHGTAGWKASIPVALAAIVIPNVIPIPQ